MKRKPFYLFLFSIVFAVIFLSYSFTYGLIINPDKIKTFKVTPDNDIYELNLLEYSETPLYPGATLQTPFNIVNNTNKEIKLESISFENFSLTSLSPESKIDSTNPRYYSFTEQVYLKFTHDDTSIFDIPLSQVINQHNFKLSKTLIFSKEAGSEFNLELYMSANAGNELQNLRANFNTVFSFTEHYVDPAPDPDDDPDPDSDPDPDDDPNPDSNPDPDDDPNPDSNPDPDDDPNPDSDPDPESDPTPDSDSTPDLDPDSDPDIDTTPDPDPDSNPDPSSSDNDTDEGDPIIIEEKLIQTGSFFDYKVLLGVSVLFIGSGIALLFNKKK